jgi:hypothetical protein
MRCRWWCSSRLRFLRQKLGEINHEDFLDRINKIYKINGQAKTLQAHALDGNEKFCQFC